MQISRRFFPEIIPDNEEIFFLHFLGVIEGIDELSILEITKNSSSYSFRLVPSTPKYTSSLIESILNFHNLFNIKIEMSKSIKSSGTIYFEIKL